MMSEALTPEQMWAELPRRLQWLRAKWQGYLEKHQIVAAEVGIDCWLDEWLWLLPLAEELQRRPALAGLAPHLGHTVIHLMRMDLEDSERIWLMCGAVAQDWFSVSMVRPRVDQRYRGEAETVFEGNARQTADYVSRLAEQLPGASQ